MAGQGDRADLARRVTTVPEAEQIAAARRTGNERTAVDGPGGYKLESPARLRAILDALPDATAVLDRSGTIVSVNHTWQMFAADNDGRPERTGIGVDYFEVCANAAANGSHDARLAAAGLRAVLAGATVQSELEYPCPSPAVSRWFLLRITPLAGDPSGAVASHVNITRRVMAEQMLAHRAAHDPLTGLANRSLFTEQLHVALTHRTGRAGNGQVGVLYLDADNFKQLNDSYGHDAGDEALLTIAHRLRAAVRSDHTVARLGGDEFAIIAPRIDAEGLDALTGRLQSALSQPYLIHGRTVHVGVSIGVHHAAVGE
jgi:diguanylate cyclase (GGDEF)-like protein